MNTENMDTSRDFVYMWVWNHFSFEYAISVLKISFLSYQTHLLSRL